MCLMKRSFQTKAMAFRAGAAVALVFRKVLEAAGLVGSLLPSSDLRGLTSANLPPARLWGPVCDPRH